MTPRLQFVLTHFRPDTVKAWLEHCFSTGFHHGSKLVLMLGSPDAGHDCGMADNGYAADEVLKALVESGWVRRCESPTPSVEQAFFGVGGLPGLGRRKGGAGAYPQEYGYEPERGCTEAMGWVYKRD